MVMPEKLCLIPILIVLASPVLLFEFRHLSLIRHSLILYALSLKYHAESQVIKFLIRSAYLYYFLMINKQY